MNWVACLLREAAQALTAGGTKAPRALPISEALSDMTDLIIQFRAVTIEKIAEGLDAHHP